MAYVIKRNKVRQEIQVARFLSYGEIQMIDGWAYTLYDFHGVDVLALEEEVYSEEEIANLIQEFKDDSTSN